MRNFYKNLKKLTFTPTSVGNNSFSILSRFCLVSLILMTLGVGQMWGYTVYAKVTATSDPKETGGYVYVGTGTGGNISTAQSSELKSDDAEHNVDAGKYKSEGNVPFRLSAYAKDNYVFKGWRLDDANSNTVLSSSNPYDISVTGKTKNLLGQIKSECKYYYYAIFARLTANKSSVSFGSVNVDSWSSKQQVTVTYVHAGDVTATLTGDFSFSNSLVSQSKTIATNNTKTEKETTIDIYFKPTCKGSRSGKLTISGSNGMTDVEITLSGTGNPYSQNLSWSSNVEENMLVGTTQSCAATSDRGLTVSYESSNSSILSVSSTGQLTANAVGGPVTITAKQTGDCTYAEATSITRTFYVKSKDTPIFTPNWSNPNTTCNLYVGQSVTLTVSNVSTGLSGDFTATSSVDDHLHFSRNGNVVTITAYRKGAVDAVIAQTENDDIFGFSQTYHFNVLLNKPTITVPSNQNMMVDGSFAASALAYSNVSKNVPDSGATNHDFYYTISHSLSSSVNKSNVVITFNPTSKQIVAQNAGTATITIAQKETREYSAKSTSFTVTVYKYNSTFANVANLNVKVDANVSSTYTLTYTKPTTPASIIGDNNLTSITPVLGTHATNFYYTLAQSVTASVTTGSPDASLAITYNAGTKTATGKNAGTGTIHLYQPETYKYNAADASFTVNVTKYTNTISSPWGNNTWSKSMNFDQVLSGVTFTATNTNYTLAPIVPTVNRGDSVATYSGSQVSSHQYIGYTTWSLYQAETYKYEHAEAAFTVTVDKIEAPSCHVPMDTIIIGKSKKASEISTVTLSEEAEGLIYQMNTNGALGNDARLFTATANSTLSYYAEISAPLGGAHTEDQYIALPEGTTKIDIETGGAWHTDDPYIRKLIATRKKYFKIENASKNEITSMDMPLNTPGQKEKRASFYLHYSTCESAIKLVSNNPRITFAATGTTEYSFALETPNAKHGWKEIELVSVSAIVADTIRGTIVAYTPSDHDTILVIAKTVGKLATHIEYVGSTSYPVDHANLSAAELFDVRDVNNHSVPGATLTLTSSTTEIATISNNAVDPQCSGNARITASYAGSSQYEAVDSTFTVVIDKINDVVSINNGQSILVAGQEYNLSTWAVDTSKTAITYTSSNNSIFRVEGNTLIAVAKGGAQLVATSAGNCVYNQGSDAISIKVRNEDDPCETLLLDVTETYSLGWFGFTYDPQVPEDMMSKPQDSLCFAIWAVGCDNTIATIKLKDTSGNQIGSEITYVSSLLPTDKNAALQEKIDLKQYNKKVKTVHIYGEGVCNIKMSNLHITQESYLRASTNAVTMSTVELCDTAKASFTVDYSDIGPIVLTSQNLADFRYEVWKGGVKQVGFVNDCGEFGTYTVKLFYVPQTVGDYSGSVILSASGKSQTVTVSGTTNAAPRTIVWNIPNQNTNFLNKTATNVLTAYAMTQCVDPAGEVTYTVVPEGAVTIDGSSITFNTTGDITITASTVTSTLYGAATPVSKTWTIAEGYIFSGNGTWDAEGVWEGDLVPTTNQDIIVTGNLTIDGNREVNSLTIEGTGSVTLVQNGTLTVNGNSDDRANYGNLHVEQEGQVVLNGTLKVNDFILDATLNGLTDAENPLSNQSAKSGQVTNAANIDKKGNAYFDLSFDPSGKISYGWYDFTVPFAVNVNGGIFRVGTTNDCQAVSGIHFLIMEADEANRANGGRGWKNLSTSALQPGKLYTITFDYQESFAQNTFSFMWNGEGALSNGTSYSAQCASGSNPDLKGWNGLGNGMLRHGYPTQNYKRQAYNHSTNTYDLVAGDKTFAVGSAFFIQVDEAGDVNWTAAEATNSRPLYAPAYEAREVDEFLLNLYPEDADNAVDALYCSASEEATSAYVIGHDLVKMGTPKDSKVARMWATKGGKNLCDVEAPLVNDNASAPLMFYAPQTGVYRLALGQTLSDATLYLTQNGNVIWNLSMYPYELELTQGMNEGYGLRIVAEHKVATGCENTESDQASMRKVIIDNTLYIITPEGAMYDVTGKNIK